MHFCPLIILQKQCCHHYHFRYFNNNLWLFRDFDDKFPLDTCAELIECEIFSLGCVPSKYILELDRYLHYTKNEKLLNGKLYFLCSVVAAISSFRSDYLCGDSAFIASNILKDKHWINKSSHRKCYVKKLFLEISQNSQENICARGSFLIKLQA